MQRKPSFKFCDSVIVQTRLFYENSMESFDQEKGGYNVAHWLMDTIARTKRKKIFTVTKNKSPFYPHSVSNVIPHVIWQVSLSF